eukprot:CAMPEP_0113684730 /NCGR_PEP_ID=MMETSP0038_2-20120614/14203_1 /TAXON_ID=2898 /ORGANISM="Cryptomonas paramecium" /LENGTH=529 /DNA_ID=CAMNT_0000604587 /DNA_START=627 /DNA_END=2212 /DNA_ORIENTATION=- /assembly_acc=CAM_ASM_000170
MTDPQLWCKVKLLHADSAFYARCEAIRAEHRAAMGWLRAAAHSVADGGTVLGPALDSGLRRLEGHVLGWRDLLNLVTETGSERFPRLAQLGIEDEGVRQVIGAAVGALADAQSILQALHEVLIKPLANLLHLADQWNSSELLIVPHRQLFFVPWAALTDDNGISLAQRRTVRVAQSMRVAALAANMAAAGAPSPNASTMSLGRSGRQLPSELTLNSEQNGPLTQYATPQDLFDSPRIVVVGDPATAKDAEWGSLPRAKNEALLVFDRLLLTGLTDLFIGCEATRRRVAGAMNGAGWVHIACHGLLQRTALVLAHDSPINHHDDIVSSCSDPGQESNQFVRSEEVDLTDDEDLLLEADGNGDPPVSDGLLTARDVMSHVRLMPGATVVLSACWTGRGKVTAAEGVAGLARAFMTAGASATAVSLWAVGDNSTLLLMQAFYVALEEGATSPEALRLAQLAVAGLPPLNPPAVLRDRWRRVVHRLCQLPLLAPPPGQTWAQRVWGGPWDGEGMPAARLLSHPRCWAGFVLVG